MTMPTNNASSKSAAMRIQKPARGAAAVTAGCVAAPKAGPAGRGAPPAPYAALPGSWMPAVPAAGAAPPPGTTPGAGAARTVGIASAAAATPAADAALIVGAAPATDAALAADGAPGPGAA